MTFTSAVSLAQTSLLVGLLYATFAIGLGISFRVLNYPDLGLEGSSILGGALSAFVLSTCGNPWLALIAGTMGGAIAGLFTGFQHLYFGVSKLLSGIITAAVLYSVNIRFLGGRANLRLSDVGTIFDLLNPSHGRWQEIVIIAVVVYLVFATCSLIFATRAGYLMRALGSNESFVVALGRNPKVVTLMGLAVSNAVIGFGGAVLVQHKHLCDVNMSSGLLVSSLAALVLGEAIFVSRKIPRYLCSAIVGTVTYSAAVALVLFSWSSDWDRFVLASDVRLFSGLLLIIPVAIARGRKDGFRLFKSDW